MSLSPPPLASEIPDSPPAEVLAEMALAAGAHDRLAARGLALRFALDDITGELSLTLHDERGDAGVELAPSAVLRLAAGAGAGGPPLSARAAPARS